MPALLTGRALVFARALGEYGAVGAAVGQHPDFDAACVGVHLRRGRARRAEQLHVTTMWTSPRRLWHMRCAPPSGGVCWAGTTQACRAQWHGELLVRTRAEAL